MRDMEYYIELREEAYRLRQEALKEYRKLIEYSKTISAKIEEQEERKNAFIENTKMMNNVKSKIDILGGQITVFNSILNYDNPVQLGKVIEYSF